MKNRIILDGYKDDLLLVYENALILYVYGRVTYNTNWHLFLLPSVFFLFHQSLEISIKTLLKLENVNFPKGKEGHCLRNLLKIADTSNKYSENIACLFKNEILLNLLNEMDKSYLINKYNYAGFQLTGISVQKVIDEIIFTLFTEINRILSLKKPPHAIAKLFIPGPVEEMFFYELDYKITYHILNQRNKL